MGKKRGHGKQGHAPGGSGARQVGGPAVGMRAASGGMVMAQASVLLERERWAEARALLEPLAAQRPHDLSLMRLLCVTYQGQEAWDLQEAVCERLTRLDPRDSVGFLMLAEARFNNDHLILALQAARHFLAHWPQHAEADTARMIIAGAEPEANLRLQMTVLPAERGFELMGLHEQALAYAQRGQYTLARQTEERLLRIVPDFAPALNTISTAYALEGKLAAAIAQAQRVLAREPENVHALGNLVAYLCRAGRVVEATAKAEALAALRSPIPDAWVKKVEAFSYLGDDQKIMEAYEHARDNTDFIQEFPYSEDPIGLHLVAVAAWHLGREAEARKLWRRALELMPDLALAQDNLDDLRKPVAQRHAPWPFDLGYWVGREAIEGLIALSEAADAADASARGPERVERAVRAHLARHPELTGVVPLLLDHGDRHGREFALMLAQMANTPEMLAALRDFALSQRGPDEMRALAANEALRGHALPSGATRLWMKGEWTESILIGFDIYDEPGEDGPHFAHSPQVEEWVLAAMDASQRKDYQAAEALYRQAHEAEPEAGDILNNLAATLASLNRFEESRELVQQVLDRYPDYLFARLNEAAYHVERGELEQARALMAPALQRKRLHISEFRALCSVQIEYWLADVKLDSARTWLQLWENVEPQHPALVAARERIKFAARVFRAARRSTRWEWVPREAPAPTGTTPARAAGQSRRGRLPSLKRSPRRTSPDPPTSPGD